MGFLKKLFGGGGDEKKEYVDERGIYFFVRSDRGIVVKVRADRQHDLNRTGDGYAWHKTIVDSKHFDRMQASVYFDNRYNITHRELSGGEFITEEEYEAAVRAEQSQTDA